MSGSSRKAGRLPQMPTEIVQQILDYLPHLSILLEATWNIDEHLLTSPAWCFLTSFVKRPPMQLRKLIRYTISIRYRTISYQTCQDLIAFSSLETLDSLPPSLFKYSANPNFSPSAALQEMTSLCDDLEQLTQSFMEMRLERTHNRMRNAALQELQANCQQGKGQGHPNAIGEKRTSPNFYSSTNHTSDTPPFTSWTLPNTQPAPPSPTETHRIRRALWRLVLYSDLFHEPNPRYPLPPEKRRLSESSWEFSRYLTASELEEIECLYFHVKEQVEKWSDPANEFYSPALSQRMIGIFGYIRNALDFKLPDEERKSPTMQRHITHFISYFREFTWDTAREDTYTDWPDTKEANRPNAGWLFLQENSEDLGVHEKNFRMQPVGCYLDWAYCIWDGWRLEEWGLLDKDNIGKWAFGQKGRKDCVHCKATWEDFYLNDRDSESEHGEFD